MPPFPRRVLQRVPAHQLPFESLRALRPRETHHATLPLPSSGARPGRSSQAWKQMVRHERGAHDERGVHGGGPRAATGQDAAHRAGRRRISNYRQTHGKLQVLLYKLPSCFPVFISELHLASAGAPFCTNSASILRPFCTTFGRELCMYYGPKVASEMNLETFSKLPNYKNYAPILGQKLREK